MAQPGPSPTAAADARTKAKEILMRHHDLEQNKDKAQGTLVSILFMTQITELKMLLDIGKDGHRFYFFVLALLIASIFLLVSVGMLIMYIGNLRYDKERKKSGFKTRVKACLLCRCRIRCCCLARPKKRANSYICVPIGVGAPEFQMSPDQSTVDLAESEDDGCCTFPSLKKRQGTSDVEKLDAQYEAAKVGVANAVVKIVRATNRVEEIEGELKRHPEDEEELGEELLQARAELHEAKRDKEEAESEQQLAESHRQQAQLSKAQWEDRQERTVYKSIMFWQQLTTFLLYFICLMNIFITAFGIYGGEPVGVGMGAGSMAFHGLERGEDYGEEEDYLYTP